MNIINHYTFFIFPLTLIRNSSIFCNFYSEEDEGTEIEEPIEELAELTLEEETQVEGNATSTEVEEAVEPEDLKGSS